ncbi:uncharacterized protein LOC131151184 [Malania oleifera]|uniref:uncharacterized protein LOC131151184 n=1 Tax=Malania oleifera TaxID=397392 RepID=UPI0025ADB949|nr:uncharacterized protein LOC131151184 [Malania oleifera]
MGQFASGCVNWGVNFSKGGGSGKWGIVSFDLVEEEFRMAAEFEYSHHLPALGVLGECLCMLFYRTATEIELRVRKGYGETTSWMVLGSMFGWQVSAALLYPMPIYLRGEDGSTLVYFGTALKVYDLKKRRFKDCIFLF